MQRNDGFLYSGINSVTQSRQSVRDRVKKNKDEAQTTLAPAAEIIFNRIEAEKALMGEKIAALIDPKMTDNQVKVVREAVRMHLAFVLDFELKFKADLRNGRVSDVEVGDE